MKLFVSKSDDVQGRPVVLDDTILTKALPTTAGSRMLEGYMSLFDATIVTNLEDAGYGIAGKANVGEFGIDLLGETSYFGACTDAQGNLTTAAAEILKSGEAVVAVGFDINGAPRRSAALAGQVCLKPTYGTISRFGTIAAACSGEALCVTAPTVAEVHAALDAIIGQDPSDGTSLPQEQCAALYSDADRTPVKRIAVASKLLAAADAQTQAVVASFTGLLGRQGIEVVEIDEGPIAVANAAWNILMSAEVCNNVSRFDGVKYGYRTPNYSTIGELYTNSRTEAFGDVIKTIVLFGSETLSTENYDKQYDKALRIRRVVCERFAQIFQDFDAVLMPACSKCAFTPADVAADKYIPFKENLFTAPASITGLPAVVAGGVQMVGKAFADNSLLDVAALYEREAR